MREPWHLLQLGSPVRESEKPLLHQAQKRLARLVDVTIVEPPTSGLKHEAGCPADRAAMLVKTLSAGAVAVLANGPGTAGLAAGDPVLSQLLPFLPPGLRGTVIGAIGHGHVLTMLKASHPELTVLMGPPVMEVIGTLANHPIAEQAAEDLVKLTLPNAIKTAPLELPHPDVYQATHGELTLLEATPPVTLHEGTVSGPLIAGNLMAIALAAGSADWPQWDNTILLWEAHQLRLFDVDRYLQRLKLLGILDALGGMLVGVPLQLIESPRARSWIDIIKIALADVTYPVSINAFVGTGFPCPLLPIGATIQLTVISTVGAFLRAQQL